MRRLRGRISIVWLFTAATVVPLLAVGLPLLWLSARSAGRASEALGGQIISISTQRIEETLRHHHDRATLLSETISGLLRHGMIPASDLSSWHRRLFINLQNNPEISAITYANAAGDCVYIARYGSEFELAMPQRGPAGQPQIRRFALSRDGTINAASLRVADYDARTRPWYQQAVQSPDHPTWTSPFRWFASEQRALGGETGVGYSRIVRDEAGVVLGVLSIHLGLTQVSEFLDRAARPLQACMLVTDSTGHMLGSSNARSPAQQFTLEQFRTHGTALERTVAGQVLSGDSNALRGPTAARISVGDTDYWAKQVDLNVSPSARWNLILAIPESAILGAVRADIRWITWLGAIYVIVAGILSAIGARLLSRPFRRLAGFAGEIGEGRFDRRLDDAAAREVSQLSHALNAMAANLQEHVTLLAQKDAAEEASALKARLIAHVSHEFRTPLNAIIGYAELMRDAAATEGHQRTAGDAANILLASRHLLGLINGLLDLSRADAGRLRLDVIDFPIASLLEEAAITIRPVVERNGNRLVVNVSPAAQAARMTSDPARIKQVLINLLSNAAKFTQQGEVQFSAELDDGGERVTFRVRDTGEGVDPEELSRIFEPFTQGMRHGSREGAGLGLAIARQLCHLLGGEVHLESEPGRGTVATVQLPLHLSAKTLMPRIGSPSNMPAAKAS